MKVYLTKLLLLVTAIGTLTGCKSGREVSKEEFGEQWPFTVGSGRVECVKELAFVFKVNGKTYGLNGFADSWGISNADLKDIWLRDPKYPDLELWVSIGAIQQAAEEQC
jgi:hypothetical protein